MGSCVDVHYRIQAGYTAIQPLVMQAPVFRELYSEKRVVFEERRMRVDDSLRVLCL